MTKEELKTHCEKTVKSMTMWKNHPSDGGRFFFNPRVLEEHQLILDLINREEAVLKALENVRSEIEERATYEGIYLDRADILSIIDKAVREVNGDCTTCVHSDETDGSNCYECVKGNKDNFEADKGEE